MQRKGLDFKTTEHLVKVRIRKHKDHPNTGHATLWQHKTLSLLSPSEFEKAIKVTVVRNPWDRILSEKRYYHGKHGEYGPWLNTGFKDTWQRLNSNIKDKQYKPRHDRELHLIPQIEYILDGDRKPYEDITIIRFENLQEEFTQFCVDKVGLHPDQTKLPWVNRTNTGNVDYRKIYTEEQRDFISLIYKEEIEYFGFKYE